MPNDDLTPDEIIGRKAFHLKTLTAIQGVTIMTTLSVNEQRRN